MNHIRSSGLKIKTNTSYDKILLLYLVVMSHIIDHRTNTSLRLQQKYMNNLYILFFI